MVKMNFSEIVILLLIIILIILSYGLISNIIILTTPTGIAILVIIGSIISAIITIIWNEILFNRQKRLEQDKEVKERNRLKDKTEEEIISSLYSIKTAVEKNQELIAKKESVLQLHLLSTGFWELSISNVPLLTRDIDEFKLLQNIDIGVKYTNKLILDRQQFILNKTIEVEEMNLIINENFEKILNNIKEYITEYSANTKLIK